MVEMLLTILKFFKDCQYYLLPKAERLLWFAGRKMNKAGSVHDDLILNELIMKKKYALLAGLALLLFIANALSAGVDCL
ncbi:hypothetical protein [Olivibacter sitiensis]|uniref:hypothetical protein n=1 Tax=Olivibacter sitiensis TaxID=376470 RepID=UPI00041E91D4|nr:hypothetical protein [Olivibacter sitiensis]